ncbi:hypothetical protein HPP92_020225 [Vanilla planifolia]|uniref:JmjN domain-containing protein n=1 Tax=Vanilla planifolia TaxID=51239 RepID=A0A835ULV3_VANPL|nr:hypothetical protein HPP92_020225 [Vanilla planifolia]
MAADPSSLEVLPWLKSLPVAPEYHPTLVEFQDPIAYILKIEQEASCYGICKIVPPVPAAPKPTVIANLNSSFCARSLLRGPHVHHSAAADRLLPPPSAACPEICVAEW